MRLPQLGVKLTLYMGIMQSRAIAVFLAALPLCIKGELLPIRAYTTADGLASDRVVRIVKDSRGLLWFCTPEGLSRYDGHRFVNFGTAEGLPHRVVNDFLETRPGTYLVATERGLCRFGARDGNKFTSFLPGNDSLQYDVESLFKSSSGRIWCGTGNGLFEWLDGFEFRPHPLPEQPPWDRIPISDILEDASGKLWVATTSGIDIARKDGSIQHLGERDGLPNDWVNAFLLDRDGRLWAGTRGGLVLLRDGGATGQCGVRQVYLDKHGRHNISALAQSSDGAIWMGTADGIDVLPAAGGPSGVRRLSRANGLVDRQIDSLAEDKAGNMWAGTEGAGVMKIATGGFVTYREQDGLTSDRVWSVLGDGIGNVLAVTTLNGRKDDQVSVFDGVRFHPYASVAPKGLQTWGSHQILLHSHTGDWWGATKAGLCRSTAGKNAACFAPDVQVFKVFEDSSGNIWASAQSSRGNRLMRWDPGTKAVSWFDGGPQQGRLLVNAFAEDHNGNIWMGMLAAGGLYRYDGRQLIRYGKGDGIAAAQIGALLVDRAGRLWIGSDNGLGLIEDPGGKVVLRRYGSEDGLASNSIRSLVDDSAGRIYAGTGKGVDRLDPLTGHVKHYSSSDGLAHGEIKSALRDASGNLWFATTQGLSRLSPTADRPPASPSVMIMDVRFGRERYPVSQAGEMLILRGELPPSQNHIQVEFTGFDDEPEESLRYTYKLEGGDSDWQTASREHRANYPGLGPGSYRFLVKAVNSEAQESSVPAEVDFTVLAPVWARWWFRALAAILAGAMMYNLYSYRLSRLLEMERLRTRIATDLHDDIGSSLSQIAILSEVTSLRAALEQQSNLADIANLSRGLLDSMSEIVWAIDPSRDRLGDLAHRMRRFASDLLTPAGMRVVFQAPSEDHRDPEMGAEIRRQVFLIFKEAVHNIVRHSDCTEVKVGFQLEQSWLSLSLSDNGKGFDPAQVVRGQGLASMEQRTQKLGGSLIVNSATGEGTAIRLQVPIGKQFVGRRKKNLHK